VRGNFLDDNVIVADLADEVYECSIADCSDCSAAARGDFGGSHFLPDHGVQVHGGLYGKAHGDRLRAVTHRDIVIYAEWPAFPVLLFLAVLPNICTSYFTPNKQRWVVQAFFSVFIFVLLASEDGFQTKWSKDDKGTLRAPAVYNGAFSTIAFLVGAITSIISGFLGMKIATYANARTALEARKGIAPAFMVGT
jgi:hypothetical protein